MITIIALTGKNGSKYPESIPEKYYGQHFDGAKFYFFESELEHKEFLNKLPVQEQVEIEKIDLSNIDIDSLTDKQIDKLKIRFGL
jgi:hypothetical protein